MEPFSLYFNFYLGQACLTFMCMRYHHVDSSLSTQTFLTNVMESADSMRLRGDLSKQMPGDEQCPFNSIWRKGVGKQQTWSVGLGICTALVH